MYLEVISPERIFFQGNVDSVKLPGVLGEFEILKNHTPITSLLKEGIIKILGCKDLKEELQQYFTINNDGFSLKINSGTVEVSDNTITILVD